MIYRPKRRRRSRGKRPPSCTKRWKYLRARSKINRGDTGNECEQVNEAGAEDAGKNGASAGGPGRENRGSGGGRRKSHRSSKRRRRRRFYKNRKGNCRSR